MSLHSKYFSRNDVSPPNDDHGPINVKLPDVYRCMSKDCVASRRQQSFTKTTLPKFRCGTTWEFPSTRLPTEPGSPKGSRYDHFRKLDSLARPNPHIYTRERRDLDERGHRKYGPKTWHYPQMPGLYPTYQEMRIISDITLKRATGTHTEESRQEGARLIAKFFEFFQDSQRTEVEASSPLEISAPKEGYVVPNILEVMRNAAVGISGVERADDSRKKKRPPKGSSASSCR